MKSYQEDILHIQLYFRKLSTAKQLVFIALLSSMGAMFQSAGGLLPGIGYIISPLSTGSILLCSLVSKTIGWISYLLIFLMLLVLQPSELIIFPFTTGLLGLGTGIAFHLFIKKFSIILTGGLVLSLGICTLLFALKYPVLGPVVSQAFTLPVLLGILTFSLLYNWLWVEISRIIITKCKQLISS